MCRYDDGDYEWYVESTNPAAVSDSVQHCQDCGRTIPAGEPFTRFTAMPSDSEAGWVTVAQWVPNQPDRRTFSFGDPFIVIGDEMAEAMEELGYVVDEMSRNDLDLTTPEFHDSCNHCRAGANWLTIVCDQHVVMVTVEDLAEHWWEYTPEQLGPDFGTLYVLSRQQWRSRLTGALIPVRVIERLARDAADFAIRSGIAA